MLKRPSLNRPLYNPLKDGNVFQWILVASEEFRKQRHKEVEMLATKQKEKAKEQWVRDLR